MSVIEKNISFSLSTGELAAVTGPNGIGKSTLLRTLAGIQPALSGDIFLHKTRLEQYTSSGLASKLSLVLTEQPPSRNLTVGEVVALGRHPYTNWMGTLTSSDSEKIKESLQLVNIHSLQHKKCFELSDGQLQKVMIARALAQDTPLIILDEPTTHLDIYHKAYILKLLKHIAHETGKTILFSSHEIELAIQLCDYMLVMQDSGTAFGEPCELIENGCFTSLFPEDLIKFDKNTGSFRIQK